ncbi:MAG: transcription-repair coupling factor [Gemmatimonadetes bacterium]|nr:MAG: transcription-repair coupling factor [Gemmatimonadota bacterium]
MKNTALFQDNPSFSVLVQNLLQQTPEQWVRHAKASLPVALASYLFVHTGRPCLFITQTQEDAEDFFDDLSIFADPDRILLYPALEALPYDTQKPNDALIAARTEALSSLVEGTPRIIITPIRAILQKVVAPATFRAATIHLARDEDIDLEYLLETLVTSGFERVPMVEGIGEFSLRGGILDIYSFGNENPVRIELFGETIDSIREFDIVTQRSVRTLNQVKILPRRELQMNIPSDATLLSYLPSETILLLNRPQELKRIGGTIADEVEYLYNEAVRKGRDVPLPHDIYEPYHRLEERFQQYQRLYLNAPGRHKSQLEIELDVQAQEPLNGNLEMLREKLTELHRFGYRLFIYCDNKGQVERMQEIVEDWAVEATLRVGTLHKGFVFPEVKLAVFTDREIFNRYRRRRHLRKFKTGQAISGLNMLNEGDFVVHVNYGIGVYWGIKRIAIDDRITDCLEIAYKDNDKLFVPVDQIKYVHKYSMGEDGVLPSLTKLGGTAWERVKARAKKGIMDMADELVKLYAERQTKRGHSYTVDTVWQRELEASFIYEETPDQLEAIEDVKHDMEKSAPMDRLICGDVGYGKTEVAIRAAFKAVLDGKQVAVLVPTTILAQQHWLTFKERLADFPVKIEMLSRFRYSKDIKRIIAELEEGKVDIVIGTHRLVQKDVKFKDLGLVIIDEEQRFGVTHKEHLKQLRKQVDVLTMTATPIPRTLHFSMMGVRDMSIINTAPQGRLPVRTEVVPFSDEVIIDAIMREVDRGGQVYFLHNRVQSIQAMAGYLHKLLPQVRFGIAHGQMRGHQLEKQMVDFLDHRFDVLVCTTIIENGVDIPNVNTIIINRADRFGLAQLYQLRGRVGRSTRLAYAYFLTPAEGALTPAAKQRLQAIEEYSELGSGLKIALRDLEIRGAGNLLGAEQSGYIEEVGFDLYCELLEDAVRELKGDDQEPFLEPDVRIAIDSYIPDEYIADNRQKIMIYKRLSTARRLDEITELRAELRDRYGAIPEPAELLLGSMEIRVLAATAWIPVVRIKNGEIYYEFLPQKLPPTETFARVSAFLDEKGVPFHFQAGDPFAITINYGTRTEMEVIDIAKRVLLKWQSCETSNESQRRVN